MNPYPPCGLYGDVCEQLVSSKLEPEADLELKARHSHLPYSQSQTASKLLYQMPATSPGFPIWYDTLDPQSCPSNFECITLHGEKNMLKMLRILR